MECGKLLVRDGPSQMGWDRLLVRGKMGVGVKKYRGRE